MNPRWGRFSARGGDLVEQRIAAMVQEVAEVFRNTLAPRQYRALIMIGGYGRGEGGVELVQGHEHPHNNLDFLLIAKPLHPGTRQAIQSSIDRLRQKFGLGIDLSFINPFNLRTARPLVIWYDMRFGHKTILGDPGFVPSLTRFELDRIPPADMRNLMVNRGTLLLINDLLLHQKDLPLEHRKTIVRHLMKAVIGYGDALLFRHGAYHWSYLERQRRMRQHEAVPEPFRDLYQEAMEFRFQPDYARYLDRDLKSSLTQLWPRLASLHLDFERWRLERPNLSWDNYLSSALAQIPGEQCCSARNWLRKVANYKNSVGYPQAAPPRVKLGFRFAGWRSLLPLLFPSVAYPLENPGYLRLAASILSAPNDEPATLRDHFLSKWAVHGDVNFPTLITRLGLPLPLPVHQGEPTFQPLTPAP